MRESAEEPDQQDSRIQFNSSSLQLTLKDPKVDLCYIMLSTEPGRKIMHPPKPTIGKVVFELSPMEDSPDRTESFCAVGLANCLTDVGEIIERKSCSKLMGRTLYITRVRAAFQAAACTYRPESPKKSKKFLRIHPPADLSAHEIQPMLELFESKNGPPASIDIKKNCLMLSYDKEIHLDSHFKIRKLRTSGSGDTIIHYWIMTEHRPLFTFEPTQLIQLPPDTPIRNISLLGQWVIFSTDSAVLFFHLYRPLENFLTLPETQCQAIYAIGPDRVVIVEYKYLHLYQLHPHKNPILLGKGKTKKIEVFSMAFMKTTAIMGGINYSYMMNEPTCEKHLHLFENFTTAVFHNKSFLSDRHFQICKQRESDPVLNLTYLDELDLCFCSCRNSIYLFHVTSESLISSVELNGYVSTIYQIDYPINLINCLVKLRGEKMLVRVSFEQYCEIMGTEVSVAEGLGEAVDVMVVASNKKEVFLSDGELITVQCGDRSKVLFSCEQGRVARLSCNEESLVFAVAGDHHTEILFLQI